MNRIHLDAYTAALAIVILAGIITLIFALPLVPGVRSLPRKLRLGRLIARYPTPGEQIPPDPNARLDPVLKMELEEEGLA